MEAEGLQKFFDSMPNAVQYIYSSREDTVQIGWSKEGWGFGSFYIYKDTVDGKWKCDSECMNKEFVKEIMCMLIDQCEFTDFADKK